MNAMNALQQKMIIRSDIDLINARMTVREFARNCGFGLRDQACISMVASSVVNSLGLGRNIDFTSVEILMEHLENGSKHGVRVSCIKHHAKRDEQDVSSHLKSSYLLVDEIQIKPTSNDSIEVIVTKWNSS
jgi:hypothetical protein